MKAFSQTIKVLVLACIIIGCSILFAACGEKLTGYTVVDGVYKNDNSTAMVVVLGKHANAMKIPDDVYDQIERMLDNTVYGGYICAVIVDSNPTKVELTDNNEFFIEDAKNNTILNKRIDNRKSEIINQLRTLNQVADSEEVDLLAAIREAKNALSNSQATNAKNKRIVIVDTGISTTGDLNFCDMDFLYGKPNADTIIEQLKAYEGVGVLPDLSGIDVTFIGTADGLAEVAEPQEAATTDKKFIRDLWASVVTACNANSVDFESAAGWSVPNVYTEDEESEFKYVSVISFSHNKVIDFSEISGYDPNNPDQQPNLPNPPSVEIKLESQTVGFVPDTAEYINEQNAKNILRPYAEDLKEFFKYYPDEKIWIVGTTAEVTKGARDGYELSFERAETVKKTLVDELGIPSDRLLTIGLGCVFPWKTNEFPNGSFDNNAAQKNRAVFLLSDSDNTDYFNDLKTAYHNNELLPESISRFKSIYN